MNDEQTHAYTLALSEDEPRMHIYVHGEWREIDPPFIERVEEYERLLREAIPLLEDEWDGTSEDTVGNVWLREARSILDGEAPRPPEVSDE